MNEELIIERLVRRIEQANTYFLERIGSSISEIKKLTPTQAQQLVNILKYGGSYEEIVRKIAEYTNLNIQDINSIFANYAENDQLFNKQFYEYRNIPFIEYAENEALKRQTEALANITKQAMYNFTRSRAIGYTIRDFDGTTRFFGLRETYERVLDEALLNIAQGKESFDSAMRRTLKDIGGSGLKTVEFQSGRSYRLDSAVRMQLQDGLRELHNENQRLFGEEFGSDGVEVTVHEMPAPDHAEVQGRRFFNEEYEKLQTTGTATDDRGKIIDMHRENKNGTYGGFRPISDYNCYHTVFHIIVGIGKPEYSEEQLQQIIDNTNKEFEFDGKKYNMYEGTQLQRKIERTIRQQKDIQILARKTGDKELILQTQEKTTQLTDKYRELSEISGLKTKMQRLSVSGYRRVAKSKLK